MNTYWSTDLVCQTSPALYLPDRRSGRNLCSVVPARGRQSLSRDPFPVATRTSISLLYFAQRMSVGLKFPSGLARPRCCEYEPPSGRRLSRLSRTLPQTSGLNRSSVELELLVDEWNVGDSPSLVSTTVAGILLHLRSIRRARARNIEALPTSGGDDQRASSGKRYEHPFLVDATMAMKCLNRCPIINSNATAVVRQIHAHVAGSPINDGIEIGRVC